jgi:hypothetical protein
MRYRSRSDAFQFSADAAVFVDLMGGLEYVTLLLEIGKALNSKGFVTAIDDLRFSLELDLLNLELLRIEKKEPSPASQNLCMRPLPLSLGLAKRFLTFRKKLVINFAAMSLAD